MNILYAIQGTGNGHLCRAMEIIPFLQEKGRVDILVSGMQHNISLPYPVTYRFGGLGFVFGKKGGVDLLATYRKTRIRRFLEEIRSLPVENYDMVISDFEPVSSWACYLKGKPCVALSHQAALTYKMSPRPRSKDPLGRTILKFYAPAAIRYGFHFQEYGKNIFPPVIRQQVREATVENKGHYTVYLPAYNDQRIVKVLGKYKEVRWQVFSGHAKQRYYIGGIEICPVDNEAFISSMASAAGIICGAGFETPAEALFLRKKLLVVPMKNQYEQQCNAAALDALGITVMKNLKPRHLHRLNAWLLSDDTVTVDYPNRTGEIISKLFAAYTQMTNKTMASNDTLPAEDDQTADNSDTLSVKNDRTTGSSEMLSAKPDISSKKFRSILLRKIFSR